MFCSNCGATIPNGCTNCPNCQAYVGNSQNTYSNVPLENGGVYYSPQPQPQPVYYNTQPNYNNNSYSSDIESAKTFGILSIILGLLFSRIVGLVLGIVGMSKVNSAPDVQDVVYMNKKDEARRLNKAGIIIPIVLFVLSIIFAILYFVIFAGMAYSFS